VIDRQVLARRVFVTAVAATLAASATAATGPAITIYKAWGCTCCEGWITHLRRAGFRTRAVVVNDLSVEWRKRGVPDALSSCHMGLVYGYTIVGHVPPADIRRLLKERPKAIGLSVPGMPDGSPGMERPDGKREPYDTLLLLSDGRSRIYARHA
jgi:hypothetical protein